MTPIEDKIECVVDRILGDYQSGRDIDKIERFHQPDRDVIVTMIEKLRRIIFPGYFGIKITGFTMPSTICRCLLKM